MRSGYFTRNLAGVQPVRRRKRAIALALLVLSNVVHADMAYIANSWANNVAVIDTSTDGVVATIAVGSNPASVAINAAGTRVYVANCHTDNTVSVIDTSTNSVVATVPVGIKPCSVAVNPSGTRVYVTNYNLSNQINSNISVIDTSTNSVVATVTVGAVPIGITVNPSGTKVYVVNSTGRSISVIDASNNTVVSTIAIGGIGRNPPGSIVINPTGTRLYVAYYGSTTIDVIDTNTNSVISNVTVGTGPTSVAINPAGTHVYVANRGSNTVSVIDTSENNVVATVPVGSQPVGVVVNAAGTHVYVANYASNTVSVIDSDTNSVVNTMTTGIYRPGSLGLLAVTPSKLCKDPAKHARYSYKTGRVDIPFTDVPLLEETSPNATGEQAVFKGLRLRLNADQDFEIVDSSAKLDDSGEPVGDPCHAVYLYENRTLKIPAVEVPTVLATFPTIKEGKPINVYEVLFQHIQTTPIDLGFLHLQEATLLEVIE